MTTRTWDTTTPADTGYAGDGDDEIRNTKVDLKERLELDHYMDGELDPLEGDCDGYHRKATLYAQATDPTPLTGTGVIYTKIVDGVTELFFRDATTGTINQLTENGVLSLNTLANDIDANGYGITGADILESDEVTAGILNVTTIAKTGTEVVTNLNADKIDSCDVQITIANSDAYVPTSGAVVDYMNTHAADTTTHGATGAVVGTTNTQTLSNKTINNTCNVAGQALTKLIISKNAVYSNDIYDDYKSQFSAYYSYVAFGFWRQGSDYIHITNFSYDSSNSRFAITGVNNSGVPDTIYITNGSSAVNYGRILIMNE